MNFKSHQTSISTHHNQSTKLSTHLNTDFTQYNIKFPQLLIKIFSSQILQAKSLAFKELKKKGIDKQKQKHMVMFKSMPAEMFLFVNHCASIIQSRFKGYQQRKYYKMFKPFLTRFKELLHAIVMGWRVRKIMKIRRIVKKKGKIMNELEKKNLREVRILKRDLLDDINQLIHRGKWMQHYKQDQKIKQKCKTKMGNIMLRSVSLVPEQKYEKNSNKRSFISENRQNKNNINNQQIEKREKIKNISQPYERREEQIEIPIKSTGFYNITGIQTVSEVVETNQMKKKESKKKLNLQIKKQGKTANQNMPKCQTENNLSIQSKLKTQQLKEQQVKDSAKKSSQKQIQPIKSQHVLSNNLSLLSLNSPIQNFLINEQTGNKTTKIEVNNSQPVRNQLLQTQKIKRTDRKGIRVTLSLNSSKSKETNQIDNVQKPNFNLIDSKLVNPNVPVQPNSKKIEPQCQKQENKDSLQEIMSVYNNAYAKKKQQVTKKMQQLKKRRKYVS